MLSSISRPLVTLKRNITYVLAIFVSFTSLVTLIHAQQQEQQYADTIFCRCELEGENLYPETALWERYYGWSARFNQPTTGGVFNRRKRQKTVADESEEEEEEEEDVSDRSENVPEREVVNSREGPDRMFIPDEERRRQRQLRSESIFSINQFEPLDREPLSDRTTFSENVEEGEDEEFNVGPMSVFSVLDRINQNQNAGDEDAEIQRDSSSDTSTANDGPQSVFTVLDRIEDQQDTEDEDTSVIRDDNNEPPDVTRSSDFIVVDGVTILPRFHEACRTEDNRRILQQALQNEKSENMEADRGVTATSYTIIQPAKQKHVSRRILQESDYDNNRFKRFNAARYWNRFFNNLLSDMEDENTSGGMMMMKNNNRRKRYYRSSGQGNSQPTSPPLFLCPVRPSSQPSSSQAPTPGGGALATEAPTSSLAPVAPSFSPAPTTAAPIGVGSDAPSIIDRSARPSSDAITEVPTANIVGAPTPTNRGSTPSNLPSATPQPTVTLTPSNPPSATPQPTITFSPFVSSDEPSVAPTQPVTVIVSDVTSVLPSDISTATP